MIRRPVIDGRVDAERARPRSGRCDQSPSVGLGALLKRLAHETRTLLRQELELAKAEVSEKAAKAGRNVAFLAVGGVVLFTAALVLLAALTIGVGVVLAQAIEAQHAAWLAPLIVGIVITIVGYALLNKGLRALRRMRFAPTKTINSMRENKEWLQDRITHNDGQRTSP